MNCLDGRVSLRAPEQGNPRWPATAVCDLGVVSSAGPSAAVYLTEDDARMLARYLMEHVPPSDLKASDYLGERVDNLGAPPSSSLVENMEFAAPGTTAWAKQAHVLIGQLLSALDEAERG